MATPSRAPMPPVEGYDPCARGPLCGDGPGVRTIDVVENTLLADCGPCHGPNGNHSGGIDYINDVDQLVANGLIVPLDSAASEIVRVMTDGSMPPRLPGCHP